MKLRFLIGHALLFVLLMLASQLLENTPYFILSPIIKQTCILFFVVTHVFAGLYFLNIEHADAKRKAFLIMLMRSAKFLLTLFFTLTMVLIESEGKKQVGLTIVVLYFAYTAFELALFRFIQKVEG